MRHDGRLVIGIFLAGAMAAAGCSSGSSGTDSGVAGKTGAGGSSAGGADGGGTDAGTDHGLVTEAGTDTTGAGGSADAHADVATDQATDTGATDTAVDMAMDTAVDTGARDTAPCVTSYGAGNPVQFSAFDGGVNTGWYTYVAHDSTSVGLTTSLGANYTEGRTCPGSLQLAVNFATYGGTQSGALEYFYGTSPAGANWTGYKALHAWVKAEGADLSELNGVYFYVKSGAQTFYQSDFVAGASLAGWSEVVIDLTRAPNSAAFSGVMLNDIQLVGFEALLNTAPAIGAPTTPSQLFLLADDIWLEGVPPSDAGTGDAGGQ